MSLTCKVLRVIAGSFLVFLVASSAWAGVSVDFAGEPVRGMKDGRVVLLLEIRSDAPLREVRIEAPERLPLTPVGARFDEKVRWHEVAISPLVLRLLPAPGGGHVQALNAGIVFQARGGGRAADVFQQGGRERRPSFVLVAVRADGKEERVDVSLPHAARISVSHE